jgi:hypothetical protein
MKDSTPEEPQFGLIIGIFDGGTDSVQSIDLSFLNLKFHKLDSDAFHQFVESFCYVYSTASASSEQPKFESTFFYHLLHDQPGGYHPNLYALVPIDFKEPVPEQIFHDIKAGLAIMFPSDFQLTNLIEYHKEENGRYSEQYMTNWSFVSRWHLKGETAFDELLIEINEDKISEANAFLRKAVTFLSKHNEFEIAVSSYLEAGSQKSIKMAYINYCIALESLVNTSEGEITYKICRTGAVVNADSKAEGEIIFFNMKQFYRLRSAIVHGNRAKVQPDYFFGLQALVSRTLIELISLEIKERKALAKFVDENGYGDKVNLKANYTKEVFNATTTSLVVTKVAKYKE